MPVARSSTGHRWGVIIPPALRPFCGSAQPQPGKTARNRCLTELAPVFCDSAAGLGWNCTGCGIDEGKIDQVQSIRENNGSAIDCLCQVLPRFETIFATGNFRALGRPSAPKVTSLFHLTLKPYRCGGFQYLTTCAQSHSFDNPRLMGHRLLPIQAKPALFHC